jgi:sugar fermentation stimulation protein A
MQDHVSLEHEEKWRQKYLFTSKGMPEVIIEGQKLRGVFLSRPNRFLALVRINQKVTPCYLPDPGRLKELLQPGVEVLARRPVTMGLPQRLKDLDVDKRRANIPKRMKARKTKHDIFAVVLKDGEKEKLVSVDSRLPNRLVFEALVQKRLKEFQEYDEIKPEFAYGFSRLDFMLERRTGTGKMRCLLEVKSCNLSVKGIALFPDAPTERGRRHVEELAKARSLGECERASILFIVQRDDAKCFQPYASNDPRFAEALHDALSKGVEAYAYTLRISEDEITICRSIPVKAWMGRSPKPF